MYTINALARGGGARRRLINAVGDALAQLIRLGDAIAPALLRQPFTAQEHGDCRLTTSAGIAVAELGGSPAQLGGQAGLLFGDRLPALLGLIRLRPLLIAGLLDGTMARLAEGIPAHHRRELSALAAAAGVAERELVAANVLIDVCCTAVVAEASATRPLLVARNLDTFPPGVMGGLTVVSVVRPAGRQAFASIGWPGCAAVFSGMNASGLCGFLLINYAHEATRRGIPLAFALRLLLEECSDVDQACARFADLIPASHHYLLLADARRSALMWHDRAGCHRHHAQDGVLVCSNGRRAAVDGGSGVGGVADDDRGRLLARLCAQAGGSGGIDEAWLRQVLTATYLQAISVHAMLLVPGERRLQLALGSARVPASHARWHQLELGPALAGAALAPPAGLAPQALPLSVPLPHYTRQDCR
jgi:hypothetical protein